MKTIPTTFTTFAAAPLGRVSYSGLLVVVLLATSLMLAVVAKHYYDHNHQHIADLEAITRARQPITPNAGACQPYLQQYLIDRGYYRQLDG